MKNQIRDFVAEKLADPSVSEETCLFTSGRMDSFAVLELIAFLEDTFRIEIDTTKHDLVEFDSIARIESLVKSLQA